MIRSLNLDGMFKPTTHPEIEYENFKFPAGELSIKVNNRIDYSMIEKVVITYRVKSVDDLFLILIAKNALEIKGVRSFDLIMPYIPYARQDRVCNEGESFTLKVFCSILNAAKFNTVHVVDAHSDVSVALIDNCVNHDNRYFVESVLSKVVPNPILISPDAGSNKKINKLASEFCLDVVKCDKSRDVKTGHLSSFSVFCDDLKGRPCLIVDDICDGGGTFIGLATELKKKGAGDLYLATTHGIYSNGIDCFKNDFKHIFSTNSFGDFEHEILTQIKINL